MNHFSPLRICSPAAEVLCSLWMGSCHCAVRKSCVSVPQLTTLTLSFWKLFQYSIPLFFPNASSLPPAPIPRDSLAISNTSVWSVDQTTVTCTLRQKNKQLFGRVPETQVERIVGKSQMTQVLKQLVSISMTFLSFHIHNLWWFLSFRFTCWVHSVTLEMTFYQTLL